MPAAYDDVTCLQGVSLEVRRDEIVTLIGANGAGKSTTLKTVSGLLTPRAGTIKFDGRTIAGRSPDAIVALGLVQVPGGRRVFPSFRWRTIPPRRGLPDRQPGQSS